VGATASAPAWCVSIKRMGCTAEGRRTHDETHTGSQPAASCGCWLVWRYLHWCKVGAGGGDGESMLCAHWPPPARTRKCSVQVANALDCLGMPFPPGNCNSMQANAKTGTIIVVARISTSEGSCGRNSTEGSDRKKLTPGPPQAWTPPSPPSYQGAQISAKASSWSHISP
jgi:hypothetical protein